MTSYAQSTSHPSTTTWPMFATLAAGAGLVLTALGTFWDFNGNDGSTMGWQEYLPVAGIVLVSTALLFGLVVRTAEEGNAARRALVLGICAVPAVLVFWSGLPTVLAIASLGCTAAAARSAEGVTMPAKIGAGLSVVVLGFAIWLAFAG